MKHTLLLAGLVALAFTSCKSNDENQNPVPENLLSGYLTVSRQLDLDSPATKYTEQAWAAFFAHPYAQASDSMHVTLDSVHINTLNTTFDNGTKMYRINAALQANTYCYWQVWSSTNIPAFTYNFTTPYPSYTYKLPDTIDRATDFGIPLPVGSDSSMISISGSSLIAGSFKGTGGSLSAASLGTLNAGAATLEVSGYKMTTQAFGGKNFLLTKRTVMSKPVWLK